MLVAIFPISRGATFPAKVGTYNNVYDILITNVSIGFIGVQFSFSQVLEAALRKKILMNILEILCKV